MPLYRGISNDFAAFTGKREDRGKFVRIEINYRNNKAVKRCENKPNTRCERRLDFHFKRKGEKIRRKRVLPLHDGAF